MLTGGRKSLMFILLAFYTPNGVTIVVLLLVVLESDMEVRYAQMGINIYI
jgi:superfamily II DNA helicase RecQ